MPLQRPPEISAPLQKMSKNKCIKRFNACNVHGHYEINTIFGFAVFKSISTFIIYTHTYHEGSIKDLFIY